MARLNKQSIYRLEKEGGPIKHTTLERLSGALGVDADVLIGTKPLPPLGRLSDAPSDESTYQIKAPLDSAIRNAFSLVSLRYKISPSRIVELAPLLFVLAAEGSLARRREKLSELENVHRTVSDMGKYFHHLPVTVALPHPSSAEAIAEEKRSIDAHDLFADGISDKIYWDAPDEPKYNEKEDNPFVRYLKELAATCENVAAIKNIDSTYDVSYQVCREEAKQIAGADLADDVLKGWALIHKMPHDLFREDAAADRIEWIRQESEDIRKKNEEFEKMSPEEQLKALGL